MGNNGHSTGTRIRNTITLVRSMKPYSVGMVLTVLTAFLKHVVSITASAITSYMIGLAMAGQLEGKFQKLFTVLVICILLRGLMYYGEMYFGHDVAYQVLKDFRIRIYAQLEKISPAYLIHRHSGQVGATFMGDVEVLEWFLAHTFGNYLVAIVVTIILLCLIGMIHPLLSILMLVFSVLAFITPYLLRKTADKQGAEVREKLAEANTITIEGIQGLKELLTLNELERYKQKNKGAMEKLYHAHLKFGMRQGIENALLQMFIGCFTVAVMGVTAALVAKGEVEFALYPTAVMLAAILFGPIVEVCGAARNLGIVFAAADRIQTLLDTQPEVKDNGKNLDTSSVIPSIEFCDVGFQYEKSLEHALKSVSFKAEMGENVVLVGPSGAGKTTCMNLLLRYWDPAKGSIKIGGTDIREMSLDSLYNMVSAVLQEVYLFNLSIRENIRLGRPDATDTEVEEAAKAACADDFIRSLPDGYDTLTGERGAMLSGGQRQRIAIARAILKNTPILILDEAVSNLDTENERAIQQQLENQSSGRITLVIAHRLSTIKAADKVVLIHDGKVLQVGTHEQLLKENEFYRTLLKAQLDDTDVL